MSKVSFTPKAEPRPAPAPRGNLSRSNSSNNTRPGSAEKSKDEKPLYVPEMQYNHAAPHDVLDDAHTAAKRIGEAPPQPMTRQLTRGNTLANLRSAAKNTDVETDEEREVVRRKSIFVAQQAVFKVEKDEKSGKEKEVNDMRSALRQTAVEVAAEAIVRGGWDNEIAAFIKKQMERRHQSISGGKWHCIVGPDFGSYVTHEKGFFTYLYLPRDLSPIERLEDARAKRHERAVRATGCLPGGESPPQAVEDLGSPNSDGRDSAESVASSAYKGLPVKMSTEENLFEGNLEREAGRRLSIAGMDPELAKLSAEHPMLDKRRSSVIGGGPGAEGEIKRMVGVLVWRT